MTGIRHLKLYHYPASRSARVKWVLHEVVGNDLEDVPQDKPLVSRFTG